ncbi:conserved hypothetical protein [Candidatus Sulfopaludibacter sp. SbA6]|nr:conserved hypothetical protein [Candidatus Sulfopaludibacter sp. SbA6]
MMNGGGFTEMAKYLVTANYTTEGLRGLAKDKASGRKAAIVAALKGLGGKLESLHYAFGDTDVFVLCDFPDSVSAAALGLAVSASGMVKTRTIPLLTVEEVDAALDKTVKYRAPGA